jgi:hypothetical protein
VEVRQNSKTVEPISTRISEDSDGVLMLRIFKEGRGEIFLEGGQRLPIRNYHSDIRADTQVKDFLAILGFESWTDIKELDVSYLGEYGAILDYEVLVNDIPDGLQEEFIPVSEFGGGSDE